MLAAADVSTRDRRLATLTAALAFDPVPVNRDVAEAWARLRVLLRDADLRMPVNDSWIAATALAAVLIDRVTAQPVKMLLGERI